MRGKMEHYGHSRSSRVIEIDTNRKPISYFLSVFHCDYYAYLLSFQRYNDLLVEHFKVCVFRGFYTPRSRLMRSQAGFSCDQGMKVGTKNQNPCAAGGENCVIVRSLV